MFLYSSVVVSFCICSNFRFRSPEFRPPPWLHRLHRQLHQHPLVVPVTAVAAADASREYATASLSTADQTALSVSFIDIFRLLSLFVVMFPPFCDDVSSDLNGRSSLFLGAFCV